MQHTRTKFLLPNKTSKILYLLDLLRDRNVIRATIREDHRARAVRRSEAQLAPVDAPKDVAGIGNVSASNVSEGEGIARDRSGLARESDAAVFRRAGSAQATGDLASVSKEVKTVEKPFETVGFDAGDASTVPSEIQVEDRRSSVSKVLSPGAENADLVSLRKNMKELQAENEDFLLRRAGNKKV